MFGPVDIPVDVIATQRGDPDTHRKKLPIEGIAPITEDMIEELVENGVVSQNVAPLSAGLVDDKEFFMSNFHIYND